MNRRSFFRSLAASACLAVARFSPLVVLEPPRLTPQQVFTEILIQCYAQALRDPLNGRHVSSNLLRFPDSLAREIDLDIKKNVESFAETPPRNLLPI